MLFLTAQNNRLPNTGIGNVHMKYDIEIPKQIKVMLWKPCCLQTDGRVDRQGESKKSTTYFIEQRV